MEYRTECYYNAREGKDIYLYSPDKLHNADGYLSLSGYPRYFSYRRDHLGNIREVWRSARNGDPATSGVVQRTQYYPSGLPWSEGFNANLQQRKYNGKEWIEAHGYDVTDLGNRGVYHAINRFTSIDRFAEKYPWQSPYVHAGNNPVNYVDVNGDSVRVYTETDEFGHSWISVGEGKKMIVYSYGRYNGTNKGEKSSNSVSNGDGVLLRLTGKDAQKYNDEKKSNTSVSVFVITDIEDKDISTFFDDKFNSSQKMPDNPKSGYYNNPSARVIDEYDLMKNNCTTVVSDAINIAGSKALQSSVIVPTSNFGTWKVYPTTNRFFLPFSMQRFLNIKSTQKTSVYKSK